MTDDSASMFKAIARPLRLTLLGLWAERLVRCLWPLWTVLIATLSALAFGLQDLLPIEVAWPALILAGLAALGFLWRGFRQFRRPTRTEALIRLDQRLPGRPLAALTDTQAIGAGDPASLAVWQAHRARMAARAAGASAVEPDLRLASRDPFALRYVALTAFVMALMFGSLWRVTSVEALAPGSGANIAAGPTWEGWAQPPAYTGKPTIYLNEVDQTALSLPVGTRLQFRLYGEVGDLTLSETVSQRTEVPAASEPVHDFTLRQSGKVSVDGPGGRAWEFTATPDAAPSVTPDKTVAREADGKLKQKFSAKDDYGIASGQVSIALDLAAVQRVYGLTVDPEPREAAVLDLPLPVHGSRAEFTETLVDDLSKHPFANLPVTMTFSVTDGANQTGRAEALHITLPGKRFFDPFAAALIEMRRDLLWNRSNAPQVAQILKAVTHRPEDMIRNQRAYLRLRVLMRDLDTQAATLTPEARDTMAEELWQIALMVDEGDLASALENLRRAQDRLDEAIRNGADKSEIDQLMKELRQAMNDYMRQLAQEAEKNPDQQQSQNMDGMQMSADQLQQMLDELQKLMEEGKTAEAQQLMEMLRQLMENMQVVQGQGQGQGQGGPGQQAMRDLQDTLRNQQGLSDDAFRDLQDGQEGEGEQGQDQGEGKGEGKGGQSLADRQRELRDKLGQLQGGQLPGDGSEQGEEGRRQLDRAGRAMDEAEDALRDGDLPRALDRQAEAMEAMRDGMQNFGDALAETQRQGDAAQGEEFGQADPNGQRDPLGREPGNSARIGSDRNMLQGQDVYRRAQDLLDEIRRRSGEQARPEGERNYLRRLLDMF
ncbi:TIGR02302 family protein [Paragemmobacter straminiformis]|uniref:TIGR02302 family protein n=1 Tax=Paragemmobacter straminiformis TaxID=2045119 RepID=A0A842I430_9RHOB|nr:TIGR02302 family protein [Gemmobacter straminiformis]MBC2834902.1 TIGR02302 family protein [Gemmobacter straminiformis]